jgi:small-conductance mechanosensitive channel
MKREERIPVLTVTTLLVIYVIMAYFEITLFLAGVIFSFSPFLIIWLVYYVIRFGKKNTRELKDDEEWGYADRD